MAPSARHFSCLSQPERPPSAPLPLSSSSAGGGGPHGCVSSTISDPLFLFAGSALGRQKRSLQVLKPLSLAAHPSLEPSLVCLRPNALALGVRTMWSTEYDYHAPSDTPDRPGEPPRPASKNRLLKRRWDHRCIGRHAAAGAGLVSAAACSGVQQAAGQKTCATAATSRRRIGRAFPGRARDNLRSRPWLEWKLAKLGRRRFPGIAKAKGQSGRHRSTVLSFSKDPLPRPLVPPFAGLPPRSLGGGGGDSPPILAHYRHLITPGPYRHCL